ncbi:MAG: (Fe-S)-binding protein [Deltaproteobacteria bacterium]|nr:(Fe-S)-binding protein [Deltaproteobacteria bacterium]
MRLEGLVMLVLVVATLGLFTWSCWTKIKILLSARRDGSRFDAIFRRVELMLRFAIGQKSMFKEPGPGLMHALIFWGFLILLFRSISVVGEAFSPGWSIFWFYRPLENFYTAAKDVTELVVLVMVGGAFFRRWVLRPWRITQSRDAELILTLIGTLMVTDFLYDGARFAVAPELPDASYAVVGAAVGKLLALGKPGEGFLGILGHASYWVHCVVLFFFLNYLPYSKHMHVLTSLPNVFFGNLQKGRPLTPIVDIENQETFGASKVEELTWKQLLDIYTCTECGRCMTNCPTTLTEKVLKPKELTERQKHHLYAKMPVLLGKKKPEEVPETLVEASKWEAIWDCTTCRSCEENCPLLIEYVDRIVELRRYLMLMEADMPKELGTTMRGLENKSNPWGLAKGDRARWAVEAGIPTFAQKPDAEYLFYLGCAGSYDDRSIKVARAIAELLQMAGVSFATLGSEEGCCGDSARRLGNEYLFQTQAQANIEVMNGYGVKKVITMCPHGYQVFKNEYPQFGGRYEVFHHTELLASLVKEGKLKPVREISETVTFHDSCYLGRYNDVYEEPRDVLDEIPGLKRVEMERCREGGFCCGAGGGRVWMEEKEPRINQLRISQAMEVKPDAIVSACPFCLMMFKDGIADKGCEDTIKAVDLAELLARSCRND